MRRIVSLLLLVGSVAGVAHCRNHAEKPNVQLTFAGHGGIALTVPADWTSKVRGSESGLPPTIDFRSPRGEQMLITILWDVGGTPGYNTPVQLREAVSYSSAHALTSAVQKTLPLVEFRGTSGTGYWFWATDRDPGTGYKHLANGALAGGDLLLSFTFLTNAQPPDSLAVPLGIMSTATQIAAGPTTSTKDVFVVPDQGWRITFEAPPLSKKETQTVADGVEFKANSGRFNISIFVEGPHGNGSTNQDVFAYYWPLGSRNPTILKDTVKVSQATRYQRVQYDVAADFRGQPVHQRSVNYFFAHAGKWVEVHISVVEPTPADDATFHKFDDTLAYGPP